MRRDLHKLEIKVEYEPRFLMQSNMDEFQVIIVRRCGIHYVRMCVVFSAMHSYTSIATQVQVIPSYGLRTH